MLFKWIVIQSKSSSENKAYSNLKKQGFEVFYPKVLRNIFVYNKFKESIKPFFPGYLFVKLKEIDNFHKISNTLGVKRIIKFGRSIPSLPEEFIQTFKEKCDDSGIYHQEKKLKKGEKIRIKMNSLWNIEAIFEKDIDSNRVIVLLKILNSKIKTVVGKESIETIN